MLSPEKPSTAALGRFSPEFRLVLLCLQWPRTESLLQAIAVAAENVNDWGRVEAIVARHRVTGLVYNALNSAHVPVPAEVDRGLRTAAATQTQLCFRLTLETVRLNKLLAGAGIQAIFLKGSALTQFMYGDLSLRFSKDIDILVRPDEVERAAQVLQKASYRPLEPLAADPNRLHTWIQYGKALDWQASESGVLLELHWKLTDLPLLVDAEPHRSVQQVNMGANACVATLSGDLLIGYLCVHGASHGWGRLKWLADVYALLPQNDPKAIEALFRRTRTLDAGRSIAQALLLCRDLFGLEIGRVAHVAEDDPALAFLRWQVLRLLSAAGEVTEVDQQRFGSTAVYLTRFFLGRGAQAVGSEARTWIYRPADVAQWRLSPSLLFLLPFKRLSQWTAERIRHGGRSSGH